MVEIRIPWLGPSTNQVNARHWSFYNRAKHHAKAALTVALKQQRIPKPISDTFPVTITLQAFLGIENGRQKRAYDVTNYGSCLKMLEDALVQLGYLPNDTPKYVSSAQPIAPVPFKDWWESGDKRSFIVLTVK